MTKIALVTLKKNHNKLKKFKNQPLINIVYKKVIVSKSLFPNKSFFPRLSDTKEDVYDQAFIFPRSSEVLETIH